VSLKLAIRLRESHPAKRAFIGPLPWLFSLGPPFPRAAYYAFGPGSAHARASCACGKKFLRASPGTDEIVHQFDRVGRAVNPDARTLAAQHRPGVGRHLDGRDGGLVPKLRSDSGAMSGG